MVTKCCYSNLLIYICDISIKSACRTFTMPQPRKAQFGMHVPVAHKVILEVSQLEKGLTLIRDNSLITSVCDQRKISGQRCSLF